MAKTKANFTVSDAGRLVRAAQKNNVKNYRIVTAPVLTLVVCEGNSPATEPPKNGDDFTL